MAGHFRGTNGLSKSASAFSDAPQFSGFMKPCRFEGEIGSLEVDGEIPSELDGCFYRVMPDPQLPSMFPDDPWFNGDGNISAFRISQGRCHFKQKYVRTEKFVREREAQRSLLGKYRNKFTDAVEFKIRSTANTNIFHFNGRLLACKEDSPPYALDPVTLETIGLEDFNGKLPSVTFTAHPKLDPETGDLVCFGYEARGEATPDICLFTVASEGEMKEVVWLESPVLAMIHDFAVTKNWVLFPLIPLLCDLERMKAGGEHWQWDGDCPFYLGVLPRYGAKGSDVKWFKAPNAFPGHTCNAYEDENGNLILDLALANDNVFVWWPDQNGKAPNPAQNPAHLTRYTFDPKSNNLDLPTPTTLTKHDVEFCRIDDRFSGRQHSRTFMCVMDPSLGTDFATIESVMGGGFPPYNALGSFDYKTGQVEVYFPGKLHMVQEPVFVPRSKTAAEGDGFVIVLVSNLGTMSSELQILDTREFGKAAAIVYLPLRLRAGLHGNWVDAEEL